MIYLDNYFDDDLEFEMEEYDCIEEANINGNDINAPLKRGKDPRNILITGSSFAKHQGRMKVSKRGENISRKTNYKDYIEIYRKNKNTIAYDGDLKSIDMSKTEYKFYEDLFIRNENLIQLVRDGDGKYDMYVDDALINDEKLRNAGKVVIRNSEGTAIVYNDNGNIDYKIKINGEVIK